MPNLKRGDRVVAVHYGSGEVRRGLVGSSIPNCHKSAFAVDDDIAETWLSFLHWDQEGVVWARGWNTKAANALRVRVALLS
jgi:hypothetical protein